MGGNREPFSSLCDFAPMTYLRTKEDRMVSLSKRGSLGKDHEHTLATQNVGADLQRQICTECGHVSINPTPPSSIRTEVVVEKAGLFERAPEFVYELAEALSLIPATDPHRPRFGERRKTRQE